MGSESLGSPRVRVIHAPKQDGRMVVMGAVLWPTKLTLLAVVESDAEEIASEFQEGDQGTMFAVTDDLGNEYEGGGGGGRGDSALHVTLWEVDFRPGVPVEASRLQVTIWVRHAIWDRRTGALGDGPNRLQCHGLAPARYRGRALQP